MAAPPPPTGGVESFDRLVSLCDPVRRDLYLYIAGRGDWTSRDDAAAAVGRRRGLVAHHLDRLAADGLLEVEYRRLTGRSGPGAGRPAKLYRHADVDLALSIPPRNPNLVGSLLADAVRRSGVDAEPVRARLSEVAREAGASAASEGRRSPTSGGRASHLLEVLRRYGYAPVSDGEELSLRNCPYEPLSASDRELVCSMNLALVEGAVAGAGVRGVTCSLRAPTDGGCCVHVAPWTSRVEG